MLLVHIGLNILNKILGVELDKVCVEDVRFWGNKEPQSYAYKELKEEQYRRRISKDYK